MEESRLSWETDKGEMTDTTEIETELQITDK